MNILIACETSAEVREQFELKGHNTWSCDLKNSAKFGNHYKGSVFDILDGMNGFKWDMMIGFPPCTHLAVSGSRHFEKKIKDGRQQQGRDFFMSLINSDIPKIAIENPVGIMSGYYRKPDQIIQPFTLGFEQKIDLFMAKEFTKIVLV